MMEQNDGERMEKNETETMDKDERASATSEPKINYRGWKAMPFIIGETEVIGCSHAALFLSKNHFLNFPFG